jgi:SAM-dependent methyltransferase
LSVLIPPELAKGHASAVVSDDPSVAAARLGANWAKRFEQLGGLTAQARILDIGCGPGRMAIGIGERFGYSNDYVGFDVTAADIDFANQNISKEHPNFHFIKIDADNVLYNPSGAMKSTDVAFPCEDASRDFIFATSIFTHFFAEDIRHYFLEARRCLAPGGVFFATFFLIPEGYDPDARKDDRFVLRHWIDDVTAVLYPENPGKAVGFRRQFILDLFTASGFSNPTVHTGHWATGQSDHSQDIVIGRA